MQEMLLALVLAALAGATMALQGALNSALGKVLGWLETTLVVHVVGTAAAAVALFFWAEGTWEHWRQAPWYTYLGGILGVPIIYGVVRSIPAVGVAAATTAILLAQIFCASLIDHLGLFGLQRISFSWYRLVGSLLMAGGAWLLLKR